MSEAYQLSKTNFDPSRIVTGTVSPTEEKQGKKAEPKKGSRLAIIVTIVAVGAVSFLIGQYWGAERTPAKSESERAALVAPPDANVPTSANNVQGQPTATPDDFTSTIEKYYSYIAGNNVTAAVELFTKTKRPGINTASLFAIARETEYLKIDNIVPVDPEANHVSVLVYLYHKKHNVEEEYWENRISMSREDGQWRILGISGDKLR
jgi:hypothetical protein